MNCYYRDYIPGELASELEDIGMPIWRDPLWKAETTYAEVFDWLINKGIIVMIVPAKAPSDIVGENGLIGKPCKYFCYVNGRHNPKQGTWHEAANRAIEDSIYLLKK